MDANVAAKDMRKVFKKLDSLPEGAFVHVSTDRNRIVFITIKDVSPTWLYGPDGAITPEAGELRADVERIAQSFRTEFEIMPGLVSYSYTVDVCYDRLITVPELQTV